MLSTVGPRIGPAMELRCSGSYTWNADEIDENSRVSRDIAGGRIDIGNRMHATPRRSAGAGFVGADDGSG